MGAIKGQVGYLRFFAEGDLPENSNEVFEEKIEARRFVPIDPEGEATESAGWVPAEAPRDDLLPVTRDLFSIGEYVVLSYREDKVTVPKDILRKAVEERIAKMLEDGEDEEKLKGREYRKAIERSVFADLKRQAFPKAKIVEVIWDTQRGVVRILAKGALAEERIASLFERTFGIKLTVASYPMRTSRLVENDERQKHAFEQIAESISFAVGGAPRQREESDEEDTSRMDLEITAGFLQDLNNR